MRTRNALLGMFIASVLVPVAIAARAAGCCYAVPCTPVDGCSVRAINVSGFKCKRTCQPPCSDFAQGCCTYMTATCEYFGSSSCDAMADVPAVINVSWSSSTKCGGTSGEVACTGTLNVNCTQ